MLPSPSRALLVLLAFRLLSFDSRRAMTAASAASALSRGGGPSSPPSVRRAAGKTIYLVRHAESDENTVYNSARRVLSSVRRLSCPSSSDVRTALTLPVRAWRTSTTDADVSEHGREQIRRLRRRLAEDGFLERNGKAEEGRGEGEGEGGVEVLVAHSPLLRARRTAHGIVAGFLEGEGGDDDSDCEDLLPSSRYQRAPISYQNGTALVSYSANGGSGNDGSGNDDGHRRHRLSITYAELECLREINPREMVTRGHGALRDRIAEFEAWIEGREEGTLIVVGHSIYFKKMLGLPFVFGNCDVWEATYGLGGGMNAAKGAEGEREAESSWNALAKSGEGGGGKDHLSLPRSWGRLRRLYRCEPEYDDVIS